MSRSSMFLLVGLLVVGIAIPALAADNQAWNFQSRFQNPQYKGYDSPAYADGFTTKAATAWNPVTGNSNGWNNYYAGQTAFGTYGIHTANGAAPADWTAMHIEGGYDFATTLSGAHVGWQPGYAAEPMATLTGRLNWWGYRTGAFATTALMDQTLVSTGMGDWGVRVNGFQPGRYRVYAIYADGFATNWMSDISIGKNLEAPVANPVRLGANDATADHWIKGTNYTTTDVTIDNVSDWISLIMSPVAENASNPIQGVAGVAGLNGFQIVKLPNLLGDADRNGKVDFQDYLALESSFGNTVTPGTGADFDNNGIVDFQDYLTLESNFGAGTVVPEPMTMSLLGLGALALIRRR